ncbi:MAG: hypothetical protein IKX59_04665 [Bacteroidales bacterium]|nr:hypothetical protein [Bacteroidales bacterium]
MNTKCMLAALVAMGCATLVQATELTSTSTLTLITPGNPACSYSLSGREGRLMAAQPLPVTIERQEQSGADGVTTITLRITAQQTVYYSYSEQLLPEGVSHDACDFYMPGFWYHRNLRSPKEAPSFHTSDSWQVREDRLSAPLTAILDMERGRYYSLERTNTGTDDCVLQNLSGDVILPGHTSVGSVGFENVDGRAALVCSFPYVEAPKRYIRKLTLIDPIRTFQKLAVGQTDVVVWTLRQGEAADFSTLVQQVWENSFEAYAPQPLADAPYADDDEAKDALSPFFIDSYVDRHELKYLSGMTLRCDDCLPHGDYQIGFVGRVLLNAVNGLEYGEARGRKDIVDVVNRVIESHLTHGFGPEGYFLESGNLEQGFFDPVLSIRRQSEGIFAMLYYLRNEQRQGRSHPEWEARIRRVCDNLVALQQPDGSFPRKFTADGKTVDASGGSTPSVTAPLVMAYRYFKKDNRKYLDCARRSAAYLEREIIDKADYFSSTLDANCEDKEAALAAATATYYMTLVTTKAERQHYVELCRKATYFCLSWYYLWDVPFAQGQMLGDLDFHSRGWGNVSVENNHIDVFVFEFAGILRAMARECNEPRFATMADVIRSSMLQLMPVPGRMCGIGKAGFYPEVVQHTHWDYGRNGKGFYNDIFAPGWTVASLWQLLSPNRVAEFFEK